MIEYTDETELFTLTSTLAFSRSHFFYGSVTRLSPHTNLDTQAEFMFGYK